MITIRETPQLRVRLEKLMDRLDTQNMTAIICLALIELEISVDKADKKGGKEAVLATLEASFVRALKEPGRKWTRTLGPRSKRRGKLPPPCPVTPSLPQS